MLEERPFPTRVVDQETPFGRSTTRHVEGSIIESHFEGHLTPSLLRIVLEDAPMIFMRLPRLDWLVDLTDVVGFDPALRAPGAELFAYFQKHGGRRIAFVSRSTLLRMLIATVAFAMNVPAKLYESRDRALDHLRR